VTYLEKFRAQGFQKWGNEGGPPVFNLGARVTVTYYPVDSTLVGETGHVRSVRGRYGSRGSEASTGAMLASPGEYLYEIALDTPPPNKPRTISVRESGLNLL
jgi:hypothetical protein